MTAINTWTGILILDQSFEVSDTARCQWWCTSSTWSDKYQGSPGLRIQLLSLIVHERHLVLIIYIGWSRICFNGGGNPKGGGANLLFWPMPKRKNVKKIDGGGARGVPLAPFDPAAVITHFIHKLSQNLISNHFTRSSRNVLTTKSRSKSLLFISAELFEK